MGAPYLSLALFSLLLASQARAYLTYIDANEEQCFFERLKPGHSFTVMFEVAEGGFLDIDLLITGPSNNVLYKGERETSGKYTFAADREGPYTACFGNKMSTMTHKTLMFTIDVKDHASQVTPAPSAVHQGQNQTGHESEDNQKLFEMITELSGRLSSVKTEQEYMQVRERTHRSINDNTNQRVALWAVFEAFILISMTIGQVFYLKRFFEVRRVV